MYIIAEIGFNHEGEMAAAEEMIRAAAQAGANAVKFQSFRAIDIALPSSPHFSAIQFGEMSPEEHRRLASVARDSMVDFLSTPFGLWAVDLLENIGVPAFKVASMDCTNRHLLGYIAKTRKPIYLSTGMATLSEIAGTLDFLKRENSGPVTLMHCVSLYPAGAEDVNLDIILLLKQLFDVPVGYSDHYVGTAACLAAAMLGAEVIETHFTLDTSKEGGDHFHSVEPDALKKLISDIELFNTMKGARQNIFNRPDLQYAKDYRRGIYSSRPLCKGDILKADDILQCRPASQLSPNDIEWLSGKVLDRNVPIHQAIEKSALKDE